MSMLFEKCYSVKELGWHLANHSGSRSKWNNPVYRPDEVRVITPVESILAGQACDFVECLWRGEANASVVLNKWGTEALGINRWYYCAKLCC